MSFLIFFLVAILGYILLDLVLNGVLRAAFRIFNSLAFKIGIIQRIPVNPQKNIDTFIGIVQGDEHNQLSIGIVDVSRKLVSFKSFVIEEVPLEQTISMYNKKTFRHILMILVNFLMTKYLIQKLYRY